MSKPVKMVLTFCTNYNGVYLCPIDDNFELTHEMQSALDEVSDTLPSMTYEMVDKFDKDLTEEQIDELIDKAKEIVAPVFPNIEVEFVYDDRST